MKLRVDVQCTWDVLDENEKFWTELDELMENIPTVYNAVISEDFNAHFGEGSKRKCSDEEVMGGIVSRIQMQKARWL